MHKMHDAKEHSCRFGGDCDRKNPGNGFARSFNRSDHEKRVHGMLPDSNQRSKNRSKNNGSSSTTLVSAGRRASHTQTSSNYVNLSGTDASSPSAGSSQVPRKSSGSHGFPPHGPTVPMTVSNHGSGHFMAQSLSGAWPFEGHGRHSIPNGSNTAPPMDRRTSVPPSGIRKHGRRRATSSSTLADHYSRKVEELRNLAASIASASDPTELMELRSLVDEALQPNMGI